MIGPMPGTLISRSHPTSCRARAVFGQTLDDTHHARRQHIGWRSENARQLSAQESQTLSDRNAALQEEGTNLIDDAGALTDQSLAYAMQRLEVELIGGLRRHELHRWTLHGFGDCLRVAEVILLSLRVRPNILRRHQPGIVAKRLELATEVMRTNTGLHADQARRHIDKACFDLTTRPLLTKHNGTAPIQADDVKRVLADIDADHSDRSTKIPGHGVLLVFGAPDQLQSLAGQEHDRTIPL